MAKRLQAGLVQGECQECGGWFRLTKDEHEVMRHTTRGHPMWQAHDLAGRQLEMVDRIVIRGVGLTSGEMAFLEQVETLLRAGRPLTDEEGRRLERILRERVPVG